MRTPWRLATFLVLSLLLAPALLVAADVRPTHPDFSTDLKLTSGKSLAEFFEARLQDNDCRSQLDGLRKKLIEKEASLKKLVSDKTEKLVIENEEKATDSIRAEFLSSVDRCGLCTTREEKPIRIVTAKSTETWYVSDGTCYLDPVKYGKTAFDRIVAKLTKIDNYPAYNGGLRHMLEFVPIDAETGALHPEWTSFERPSLVFTAVKGPQLFGKTLSMQYVIKNEVFEKTEKDGSFWGLRFQGVPAPRDFQAPDVFVHRANGGKSITGPFKLNSVLGQWHVDSRGFVRYYTAADFGSTIPFADAIAKTILLDTLAHVYELGTQEKP